ncbi:MAG: sulfatase-like hydrolase/transferase [Deltaproteobacteria bacterium]|nr:sulfatase-like hydrolase/transferase [Deltaproteobacteria bacterium]
MWLALAACSDPPARELPPDIVLVSLDTTRADALDDDGGLLHALGRDGLPPVTPNLSALAARGARFEMALAHAPTTLSSHAAVFTGTDGHGHGVVRNGWPLGPALPTLAAEMRARGYATSGVVGASVLARSTGISRGFDRWDDEVRIDRGPRHEAPAADVTDRALRAVQRADPSQPLLLFVHYFDAHAPYSAPEPYTRRYADPAYSGFLDGSKAAMKEAIQRSRADTLAPADLDEARARYLGEVAYVDHELGRLLAGLRARPTTIVVFGDHGETLGEDPLNPFGHGGDVEPWALRVPLIVTGPGVEPGHVVSRQVRLQDIGATLLGRPLGDGVSLFDTRARPAFAEASQPEELAASEGWPNLPFERGVYQQPHLFTRFPAIDQPGQLYTVTRSAIQPVDDPAARSALAALLDAWDARAPGVTRPDADAATREALEALGYAAP